MATHPIQTSRTKKNWLLDLLLFGLFLVSTAPHTTGMAIHEWLGIALAGGIVIHLLLHWPWVVTVIRRFFKRLPGATRINALLNGVLFVGMAVLVVSGLLISEAALPLLGLQLQMNHTWEMVHKLSADLVLIVVAIHVGLHGTWLLSAFRTYLWQPVVRLVHSGKTRAGATGSLEVQS